MIVRWNRSYSAQEIEWPRVTKRVWIWSWEFVFSMTLNPTPNRASGVGRPQECPKVSFLKLMLAPTLDTIHPTPQSSTVPYMVQSRASAVGACLMVRVSIP